MNAVEHASCCTRILRTGCVAQTSASSATRRAAADPRAAWRGMSELHVRPGPTPSFLPSFSVWTFRMGSVMVGQCCPYTRNWGEVT